MNLKLTPEQVKNYHNELWHTPQGRFLRDLIFGANDGIVTTVAFIIATMHAVSDTTTLIWVTLIEVLAGALSMGAGAFMAQRSQTLFFKSEIDREKYEMEYAPNQEIQEVKEFFQGYGFTPEEQDIATKRITQDKDRWLRFMMKEEFSINESTFGSPMNSGLLTSCAFVIGAIPLVIPVLIWGHVPLIIATMGAFLLFGVGLSRYKFTNQKPLWAGLENLATGLLIMLISDTLSRLAMHAMN